MNKRQKKKQEKRQIIEETGAQKVGLPNRKKFPNGEVLLYMKNKANAPVVMVKS